MQIGVKEDQVQCEMQERSDVTPGRSAPIRYSGTHQAVKGATSVCDCFSIAMVNCYAVA